MTSLCEKSYLVTPNMGGIVCDLESVRGSILGVPARRSAIELCENIGMAIEGVRDCVSQPLYGGVSTIIRRSVGCAVLYATL